MENLEVFHPSLKVGFHADNEKLKEFFSHVKHRLAGSFISNIHYPALFNYWITHLHVYTIYVFFKLNNNALSQT